MAFGDQDLGIFFQDGSTAVLANGVTFMCHLDVPEVLDQFATVGSKVSVVAGHPQIRYATADAPPLKSNDVVRVNGVAYRVRQSHTESDGLVSVADLKDA